MEEKTNFAPEMPILSHINYKAAHIIFVLKAAGNVFNEELSKERQMEV